MHLDKYQQAWKADAGQSRVTIDVELLSNEVQRDEQGFRSRIFWRDVREAGGSLFLIPIWFVAGFALTLPWTWYLCVPGFLWVAAFIWVDRRRHPQRPSGPGQPLGFYVKESLTQVEHQIWLLRNVFWWYLLPYAIPAMAFSLHLAWQSKDDWWDFVFFAGFVNLFLVVIYGAIYRVNQNAIRTQLEPRRQDLLKLVASLEDEANSEDSGDIMELVSNLAVPVRNVGLSPGWEQWAENWNRIIPSWFVAAAIILPTMIGAGCGFWFAIPDMGPVFFQSVVAAVIPFEMALGYAWLRSYLKQKRSIAAGGEMNSPASDIVLDHPADLSPKGNELTDSSATVGREPSGFMTLEESRRSAEADTDLSAGPKRLPRAPAIVIIVLTVFIGIMAFFAVYVCIAETKGELQPVHGLSKVSAQKRFAENLVEVLSKMGHQPDLKVSLELKTQGGQVERLQVLMTKENRNLVWQSLRA